MEGKNKVENEEQVVEGEKKDDKHIDKGEVISRLEMKQE